MSPIVLFTGARGKPSLAAQVTLEAGKLEHMTVPKPKENLQKASQDNMPTVDSGRITDAAIVSIYTR